MASLKVNLRRFVEAEFQRHQTSAGDLVRILFLLFYAPIVLWTRMWPASYLHLALAPPPGLPAKTAPG